jgi:hypothetical protein
VRAATVLGADVVGMSTVFIGNAACSMKGRLADRMNVCSKQRSVNRDH